MNKIVLIEDDEIMQGLLKTLLELEGYTVCLVKELNEESILNLLKQELPDVILLDVHLRGVSGLALLSRVRQDASTHGMTVIMTSGMDMRKECYEKGANWFLMKPYMPHELIKWLQERLNNN
jgi:DNA-binding response OmpR family regulator